MPSSMVWGPWRPGQIQHLMGWAISSYRPVQVMVSVGLRTPVSRAASATAPSRVITGIFITSESAAAKLTQVIRTPLSVSE